MSRGRPGMCTSPAEIIVVTPPCIEESIQLSCCWRGVQSPATGCTWLSISPGATVVPCVIYGTWRAWPRLTGLPHPAKIVVDFLPPIAVDRADTRENHQRIAEQVREAILAEQLKHRIGPAPAGSLAREAPDY